MSLRHRAVPVWALGLAALAAVASVVLGVGVSSASAVPQSVPVTIAFTNLGPGQTQTGQLPFSVPVDSQITRVALDEAQPDGTITWQTSMCGPGAGPCVPLTPQTAGVAVVPGTYVIAVSATNVSLGLGQSRTLQGRVWLEQTGGDLAATGAFVWPLLAVSAALTSLGLLLLAVGRRRRRADVDEVVTTC